MSVFKISKVIKYCLIFKEILIWSYLNVTQLVEKQNLYFNETNWKIPSNNLNIPDLTSLKITFNILHNQSMKSKLLPTWLLEIRAFSPKCPCGVSWGTFSCRHHTGSTLFFALFSPRLLHSKLEEDSAFIAHLASPKVNTRMLYLDAISGSHLQGSRTLLGDKPPRTPVHNLNLTWSTFRFPLMAPGSFWRLCAEITHYCRISSIIS